MTYDCAWFNRYLDLMLITFMIYNNTFLQIKELKVFLIPTYVFKKVKEQLYVSRKYEEMKILSVLNKTTNPHCSAPLQNVNVKIDQCALNESTFKWSVRTNSFRWRMLPTIASSILNKTRNWEQVDCHYISSTGDKNRNGHLPKYIVTLLLFFKEM